MICPALLFQGKFCSLRIVTDQVTVLHDKVLLGKAKEMMHNPPHPGEVIRALCLEPIGISVTEAAKALGVSRKALSSLLNGHTGVTPEMALRLAIAFETTPESWLVQQMQYDLWKTSQKGALTGVQRLKAA
jgi:addiction module HigA family antidote